MKKKKSAMILYTHVNKTTSSCEKFAFGFTRYCDARKNGIAYAIIVYFLLSRQVGLTCMQFFLPLSLTVSFLGHGSQLSCYFPLYCDKYPSIRRAM